MLGLDTNVLVRLLVDDPGGLEQCQAVRRALQNTEEVYVSQVVQIETVWVLKRAYKMPKPEIMQVLEHLQNNHAFVLDRREIFSSALVIYRDSNVEFSDGLALAVSRSLDVPLLTFDKRLLKLEGTAHVWG